MGPRPATAREAWSSGGQGGAGKQPTSTTADMCGVP